MMAKKKASTPDTPNAPNVEIDYAQWDGLFEVNGAELTQGSLVIGQFTYLGCADCPVGYVEVSATFFSGTKNVGTGSTNFTILHEDSPVPLEIYGPEGSADRVELVMTEANCK